MIRDQGILISYISNFKPNNFYHGDSIEGKQVTVIQQDQKYSRFSIKFYGTVDFLNIIFVAGWANLRNIRTIHSEFTR